MIDVLEVDQWTSTGDVKLHLWDALKASGLDAITGGDSRAARLIFGGRLRFYQVNPLLQPSIGSVWFTRGEDGYPKFYRANYDSSD